MRDLVNESRAGRNELDSRAFALLVPFNSLSFCVKTLHKISSSLVFLRFMTREKKSFRSI